MLSCKQASKLASDMIDRPLSFKEHIALKFHLFICRMCARYATQIKIIHQATDRLIQNDMPDTLNLPEDARQRIQQTIDKEMTNNKE